MAGGRQTRSGVETLTGHQPLGATISSDGPCDRRNPCPRLAGRRGGLPRSHGLPDGNRVRADGCGEANPKPGAGSKVDCPVRAVRFSLSRSNCSFKAAPGQARSLRENQANASVRPRRMSARHCHRRISYRIGTECSGARDRPPPAGAWADWHVSQPGSGKNLSSRRRNGLIPPSGPPKVRPRVRQQHARSAASARRA
jgi:hypothetical protein